MQAIKIAKSLEESISPPQLQDPENSEKVYSLVSIKQSSTISNLRDALAVIQWNLLEVPKDFESSVTSKAYYEVATIATELLNNLNSITKIRNVNLPSQTLENIEMPSENLSYNNQNIVEHSTKVDASQALNYSQDKFIEAVNLVSSPDIINQYNNISKENAEVDCRVIQNEATPEIYKNKESVQVGIEETIIKEDVHDEIRNNTADLNETKTDIDNNVEKESIDNKIQSEVIVKENRVNCDNKFQELVIDCQIGKKHSELLKNVENTEVVSENTINHLYDNKIIELQQGTDIQNEVFDSVEEFNNEITKNINLEINDTSNNKQNIICLQKVNVHEHNDKNKGNTQIFYLQLMQLKLLTNRNVILILIMHIFKSLT